jgi:tetrapyrrole methylase family protein/MazG family protein
MADVIAGIDAKIKRRHPHVWGELAVAGTKDVTRNWEMLKAQERRDNTQEGQRERSMLDGVPKALPALAQADAYGRRAARVGFDWPDVAGVVAKIGEEMEELGAATRPEERLAEMGDLLFALVSWARWLDVDPEAALRQANARFARRFAWVEVEAARRRLDLAQLDLDELKALWQMAKHASTD